MHLSGWGQGGGAVLGPGTGLLSSGAPAEVFLPDPGDFLEEACLAALRGWPPTRSEARLGVDGSGAGSQPRHCSASLRVRTGLEVTHD